MRRLGISVAVWATCLIAAGCTSTVDGSGVGVNGSGARGAHAPTAEGLPGLLLSLDEMKQLLKFSDMATEEHWTQPDPKGTFAPADCVGAVFSGMSGSYQGSGYQDFYQVRQTDISPDGWSHWVDQGVVTFQSAAAAKDFVEKQVALWRRCTGVQLVYAFPDPGDWGEPYLIGNTVDSGCATLINNTVVGDNHYDDIRVLAAKSNIAVDLQFTGFGLTDEPMTATTRILDRISSQERDCAFWG